MILILMRSQYNFDLWAIDVPAGLDATTGQIAEGTLAYDYTVTFGAIKQGLLLYPGKAVGYSCCCSVRSTLAASARRS